MIEVIKLFKKCLRFLLDGNIITGLSAKKIVKKVPKSEYILPTFEDVMKYLKQNNTGTDYDISMIQAFLDTHKEDREFYEQMITKSFKLGADSKIINTCIPNLIPTWEVMLGTSIEHCKIPEGTWFSLSQKLNGNRCTYYNGEFYTRQNKRYIGLGHIKADIESIYTERMRSFSEKTIAHVRKMYDEFGCDMIFGRSAVVKLLGLQNSSVSKLLSKLLKADIIEPIPGCGKGKYRFSRK